VANLLSAATSGFQQSCECFSSLVGLQAFCEIYAINSACHLCGTVGNGVLTSEVDPEGEYVEKNFVLTVLVSAA